MASSQVEFDSSSSPNGFVLKDRNHRERFSMPSSNLIQKPQTNFQKNFKILVRDHFHSCISMSGRGSKFDDNENSCPQTTCFGCWGSKGNNHYNNHFEDVNANQTSSNKGNDKYNEETSSSYLMSKQQFQAFDQCVVQQKEDKVITTETQSHRTHQKSLLKSHSVCSRASSSMSGPSPTSSNCSSTDISVSSLVQIWKGFESEVRHSQCNKNRGNQESQKSYLNTNVTNETNKVRSSMSNYEPTKVTSKDHIQGCTVGLKSSQCTSQYEEHHDHKPQQQHDAILVRKEKEGINVANMVRTWANTYQVTCDQINQEEKPSSGVCLSQLRTKMDTGEKSPISSPIIYSHKLRGRQAISHLYMRMERERYKEVESLTTRQAVTKFSQYGRIQSLLRLRLLRREANKQEQQQPSRSNFKGSNQAQVKTTIHNIRERLCTTTNLDNINKMNFPKESTQSAQKAENVGLASLTFKQTSTEEEINQDEEIALAFDQTFDEQTYVQCKNNSIQLELNVTEEQQLQVNSRREIIGDLQEQNASFSVQRQETIYEGDVNLHRPDATSITIPFAALEDNDEKIEEQDFNNNEQQFGENLDWIIDIARPRTYWEQCRQARYKEVLNNESKDKDIRQLIERGKISSILTSEFREKMDRLLMCSIQRLNHSPNNEERQIPSFNSYLKQEQHNQENKKGHIYQESHHVEENEDTEFISSLTQYPNVRFFYQTPLFSQLSWDSNKEDEPSEEDCNHIVTTFSQQPSSSGSSYCHNNEGSPLKNISTIDIELIYDMRTHMQQLNQEMFDLRKSITTCMDMQEKWKSSIKEEVSIAISQKDQNKQKHSNGRQPKKGNCHICYDQEIDSLLYRCGHMCTCFNCANELRWSSGKCPICRAQIIDVVRTYLVT